MRTTSITHHTVNNKHQQNFGGYRMYWKLYAELIRMVRASNLKINIFKRIFMGIYTFLWYCLIKPLGQFYSVFTQFKGEFKTTNGHFENINLVKRRTYKIFGIPFFWWPKKLTESDIKELTK